MEKGRRGREGGESQEGEMGNRKCREVYKEEGKGGGSRFTGSGRFVGVSEEGGNCQYDF